MPRYPTEPTLKPSPKRRSNVYLCVGGEVRYAWDSPRHWDVARRALDWVRLHETEDCILSNSAKMGKLMTKPSGDGNKSQQDTVEVIDIRD